MSNHVTPRAPGLLPEVLALCAATLLACSLTRAGSTAPSVSDASAADAGAIEGAMRDAALDGPDAALGPCTGTSDGGRSGPPPGFNHRGTAQACSPSGLSYPDAGTCTTTGDCKGVGLYTGSQTGCLHGLCTYDSCESDDDCGEGSACECGAGFVSGSYTSSNACGTANCRSDADCATGRYCLESPGYCGRGTGFYCTTPADTCVNPQTDCPCPTDNSNGGMGCVYSATVAHWVCGVVACNG